MSPLRQHCPGHCLKSGHCCFHRTRRSFSVRAVLAPRSASCLRGLHRTATGAGVAIAFCRIPAEQAAQFAAIGHTPIALAEALFAVHGGDEIQCLLPGEGKFRKIGTAAPDQSGQTVHDFVVAYLEARFRPRRADGKRCILAGPFARNLATIVGMASACRYPDNAVRSGSG